MLLHIYVLLYALGGHLVVVTLPYNGLGVLDYFAPVL